jgi:hypothetical protein
MSAPGRAGTTEDWLIWLGAISAAAESKEQLHSLVDEAIAEFVKDADAGQRAEFAAALRRRQHPVSGGALPAESSRWADWPAVVQMAVAKLEAEPRRGPVAGPGPARP